MTFNETIQGHKSPSFAGTKIKLSSAEVIQDFWILLFCRSSKSYKVFFLIDSRSILPAAIHSSGAQAEKTLTSTAEEFFVDSLGVDVMFFLANGLGKTDFSLSLFSSASMTLESLNICLSLYKWD